MREIKFRAWKSPYMVNNLTLNTIAHEDEFCLVYKIDDYIIMQYTGLKDKNGTEIYEGDILREPADDDWDKINFNCHEVFFHTNDACSYHIGWQMDRMHCHGAVCGGYTPSFKPSTVSKLIIIGNIYENPELINQVNTNS